MIWWGLKMLHWRVLSSKHILKLIFHIVISFFALPYLFQYASFEALLFKTFKSRNQNDSENLKIMYTK